MTSEEAIKHGKEQSEIFWGKNREFAKIATRSLEAWGEVIEDIKQYKINCDMSTENPNCLICNNNTFNSIERIINKHLNGVES